MLTLTNRIDMRPGAVPLVIHLGQYDSDFSLVFELYSSAGNFTVESGTTAMIRGTKTDGNAYDADVTIDVSAKTVTVAGSEQMTAAKGRNVYELVLTKSGKVLSTANFILDVERAAMDADTIASESVLKELNAIIAGAETATEAAQTATAAAESVSGSTAQIATNTANIATNTADISDLKADIDEICFGEPESKSLTTLDTIAGSADISKYWGYKIPFDKDYAIKSITFSASASSTIHLYIANRENDAYVIIHDLGTKTVSSGQNTIQICAILPSDNCYLIFKGGYVGYNRGGLDTLMSFTLSDSTFTVNESLAGWGLLLTITAAKTRLTEAVDAIYDELYVEKTLPLSTKTTASGQIDASKYWAYKIPLNVGITINKIAFPNSANSTGNINIYLATLNGTTFTITNSLGTFTVTTGNNEYDVHVEISAENTYIIIKADYGFIGYTNSGGFDKLISVTYSSGVYTVSEQLNGWGLILNIGYIMSRLDELEDKIGDAEEEDAEEKSVIKVAKDGSGDFVTIKAAMAYADTYMSKAKPVTILVYPGTYEEVVNAYGRRNLSIIGINRDTCIIRNDTGVYDRCPLRIAGNSYVANLTLISTHKNATNYIVDNVLQYNPSYALHIDDRHFDDDDDYVCTIENCRLYCEQNPAIGIGLDKNQTVNIINCEIETKETADMLAVTSAVSSAWGYKPSGGAVFYHALYRGNYTNDNGYQKLVLKDNIIKSNIPNAVAGEYGGMMDRVEFTFVGNSGYSTNNGKVWSNPLTGTTLNPISSGNNITSMNAD